MIACGDRSGTISIYSILSNKMEVSFSGHEAEITVLEFVRVGGQLILASGGRDRKINIFDASESDDTKKFDFIQRLDDHTSTVTAIVFSSQGLYFASASADKSVVFRKLVNPEGSLIEYRSFRRISLRSAVYDMKIYDTTTVLTANQDRKLMYINLITGEVERSIIPSLPGHVANVHGASVTSFCTLHDLNLLAICSSDKSLRLIGEKTGVIQTEKFGHGDLITDVINLGNNRLASSTGDGCIFVWKVTSNESIVNSQSNVATIESPTDDPSIATVQLSPFLKIIDKDLPVWARADASERDLRQEVAVPVKGRWAEVI